MSNKKKNSPPAGFWRTVRRIGHKVPFVRDAVALYHLLLDARTPAWVKTLIATTLVYLVMPLDAVPDFLGPMGYLDDASLIAGTIAAVGDNLRSTHYERADESLS